MQQLVSRWVFTSVTVVSFGLLAPTTAQAGLIPWVYDSIFGYGPSNYGVGYYPGTYGAGYVPGAYSAGYAPATYGVGYYPGSYGVTSMYAPMTTPVTTYYGPTGYGGCGSCNPCSTGCGPCSSGCNPCGTGNCPGGDCGTQYSPPADSGTAEPTEVTPRDDTPRTFQKKPPADDFRPSTPRDLDSTVPGSTIPKKDDPSGTDVLPGDNFRKPAPFDPAGGGTIPRGGAAPAPGGNTEEVIPALPPGVQAEPLEIEPAPVAGVQLDRQRIMMQAGYRIPSVARIRVNPKAVPKSGASIAQK